MGNGTENEIHDPERDLAENNPEFWGMSDVDRKAYERDQDEAAMALESIKNQLLMLSESQHITVGEKAMLQMIAENIGMRAL